MLHLALGFEAARGEAFEDFLDDGGTSWVACENFRSPTGGIALLSADGEEVWLPKSFAKYVDRPDDAYYLGLGKSSALEAAKQGDVLGSALLACNHSSIPSTSCFTWDDVATALPPIRRSGPGALFWPNWEGCDGVRTFVGSRSSSTASRQTCAPHRSPPSWARRVRQGQSAGWVAGPLRRHPT